MPSSNQLEKQTSGRLEWLFRRGELVLGPVLADEIVQRLYSGDLTAQTEIKPLGENLFRPLGEVDCFRVHLAKAEAKLRVDAIERVQRADRRRRRNVRVGLVVLATLAAAVGAGALARHFAIHTPFKAGVPGLDISVEPPTIALARRAGKTDNLVEYPLGRPTPGRSVERAKLAPSAGRTIDKRSEDPDGLQTGNFDRAGINSVVAARQKTLYSCVASEVNKHPGLQTKIPIEFVIGNDGHVSKVWVDHSIFKDGPLQECLLKELQKWPFKPYEGERATVGLSFKVGRGS